MFLVDSDQIVLRGRSEFAIMRQALMSSDICIYSHATSWCLAQRGQGIYFECRRLADGGKVNSK